MKKTFAATQNSLREMVSFVKKEAEKIGFLGQSLNRIELIAEEALINIISYGYPPDKIGTIEIECTANEKKPGLKCVVIDDGKAYDPLANANEIDVNATLDEVTYGGYGVFFIRTITDEVFYQRKENRNVLTMIKYLE